MKKEQGFSLVELLVALIAISCIIAAFAPVMTKRMKNTIGLKGKSNENYKLFLTNTSGCVLKGNDPCGHDYSYMECSFAVPSGVTKLNAIVVGGGNGGGGAVAGLTEDKELVFYSTSEQRFDVTEDMYDFKIEKLIGGGGGGGAGYYNDTPVYGPPTSQDDCDKYNATYSDGICISKLMNSTNGPSSYTPPYHSGDTTSFNGYLCTTVSTNGSGGGSMPVCQFRAAQQGCSGIWRLPSTSDISKINAASNLGLCSQGHPKTGGCVSGTTTLNDLFNTLTVKYVPYYYWFNGNPQFGYLVADTNGKLSIGEQGEFPTASPATDLNHLNAYGAFCVADQIQKNPSVGGGGGALGTMIQNFSIDTNNYCDKIETIRYAAGAAGKGANYSSGTLATAGGTSYVSFEGTKEGLTCNYGFSAFGGRAGANATASSGGSAAQYSSVSFTENGTSAPSNTGCSVLYLTAYGRHPEYHPASVTCSATQSIYHGESGTNSLGGWGGTQYSSHRNTDCTQYRLNGCPGNSSYNNGATGGISCGGGGGGYGKGNGGNGDSGMGKITYKKMYKGAAGAGGYQGDLVHVESIPVKPGQTCTIRVGKGGKGGHPEGSLAYDLYTAGGLSSLICGSDIAINLHPKTPGISSAQRQTESAAAVPGKVSSSFCSSGNYAYIKKSGGSDVRFPSGEKTNYELNGFKIAYSNVDSYLNSAYAPTSAKEYDATSGVATGGKGGIAPTQSEGGYYPCGGYSNADGCNNAGANGVSFASEFKKPGDVFNVNNAFGLAGAGGAGGGWKKDGNVAGNGGDGQDGYVLLYWENP